ncbi:WGxxGxxG family protein [Paenibacillus sp. sgz302251]|uniref:WGxxGxxG family protein n=1 Tax=Paenibacillus sp. sgz302251 TaxID=3414493 RepID=UPI003C7C7588
MKKAFVQLSFLTCLMLFFTVPAFADNTGRNSNYTDMGYYKSQASSDHAIGNDTRNDVTRGISNTNQMNTNATRYSVNNYRATTATDDGFDWGWLGLLGLIGLAGMRSRERDRDRT